MSLKRVAAIVYGTNPHHLDHIAPLAHMLNIPLITNEQTIKDLTNKYYPKIDVQLWSDFQMTTQLIQNYERIISCLTRVPIILGFNLPQFAHNKIFETLCVPHGNSDKGRVNNHMLKGLQEETEALFYGQKMLDYAKESNMVERLENYYISGNYRKYFFLKHRSFYDDILINEISSFLQKEKKNILYAPTWDDQEKSSSFFIACNHMIDHIPDHYNLIVKLHPNLFKQNIDDQIDRVIEKCEKKANVFFLKDFPPIYPLLSICDIYLGDMSSIGYDFLYYQRPMFFFNTQHLNNDSQYLHKCGTSIDMTEYTKTYKIIDAYLKNPLEKHKKEQEKTYSYTYEEDIKSYEKYFDDLKPKLLNNPVYVS